MQNCHVTVTLPGISGLAEDNVVNTFTFSDPVGILPADLDAITAALFDFYRLTAAPQVSAVSTYLGPALSRSTTVALRFYDIDGHLDGSPVGSPERTDMAAFDLLGSASATGLPSEVAVCLTLYAAFGSDVEFGPGTRPRARDRGRVYIGPLNQNAMTTALGRTRPEPGFVQDLAEAGARLARAPMGPKLSVWSRRAGLVRPVERVSVDDAFDTQRRRGIAPTAKTFRVA
jgi:hypothetical protein